MRKGPKVKPEPERFWPKVDKTETCWLWTTRIAPTGYGMFGVGSKYDGTRRLVYAHRWAYEHLVGPIPEGLHIDHLCRVRHCVNPAHLEVVTCAENVRRGQNAVKTHCKHGHLFDDKNTYRNAKGHRKCRRCRADWMRSHYYRTNP